MLCCFFIEELVLTCQAHSLSGGGYSVKRSLVLSAPLYFHSFKLTISADTLDVYLRPGFFIRAFTVRIPIALKPSERVDDAGERSH